MSPIASLGSDLPAIWVYVTTDAMSTVRTAGYFPKDIGLNLGDIIEVQVVNQLPNKTSVTGHYRTYINAAGAAVDVVDGVQITATDTD